MQAPGPAGGSGGQPDMSSSGGAPPAAEPDAGTAITFDSCLPMASVAAPDLLQLYMGELDLRHVARTAQGVMAADPAQGIYRFMTDPAPPERVVATQLADVLAGDLNVYWLQPNGASSAIWKARSSDTDATPDEVVKGLSQEVAFLRYGEEDLYFADRTAGGVYSVPIAGGMPVQLVSGVRPSGLLLHAGYLYYSDETTAQVSRYHLVERTIEALTTPSPEKPSLLQTDGETVYWVGERQIFATPIGSPSTKTALGQGGMGPGGSGHIRSLVLDADNLYWSDEHGNLGTTSASGESCRLLLAGIRAFDLDDTSLYVASEPGPGRRGSELVRVSR